jgi:hypothetical protein
MRTIVRIRRQAEVWFTDGSRITGSFFLEPVSPHGQEPQSLLELLNAPRRFLPLETENGELLLVQKNGLVLARSNQCILVQRSPHAKDIPVSVELLTGDSMDGTISHDLPESYPRISDFLNFSPQFFALRIDGWDCLLNSESVRSVRPVKEDQGDAASSAASPFRSSP